MLPSFPGDSTLRETAGTLHEDLNMAILYCKIDEIRIFMKYLIDIYLPVQKRHKAYLDYFINKY